MCSCHDIAEILQKLALSTNKSINQSINHCVNICLLLYSILKPMCCLRRRDQPKILSGSVYSAFPAILVSVVSLNTRGSSDSANCTHENVWMIDLFLYNMILSILQWWCHYHHDITAILLRVSLNAITLTLVVPLIEQELVTFLEHMCSRPFC